MPDINAAFSANMTVAQKTAYDNVVNKVTSGVKGFADAAQSGIKSAGLKISSLFEKKDFAKAPAVSGSTSPEIAKKTKSKFVGSLVYPSDLQYYTIFSFIQYNKKEVVAVAKDKPTVTIILPLPANLSESFAVEYQTPELGPVVGAAAEGIIKAVRQEGSAGGAIARMASGAGENLVTAGEAGILYNAKKMGGAGETAAQIGSMALGVAPNPHLAVLFSNIGLRSHKFSYKFAPRSAAELTTIKEIIYNLKHKMLPGLDKKGGMLFSFPDVVDIRFVTGKGNPPYTIKQCVMESLDVNYSPSGSPAFFKTGDPVVVEISMSFKETSPYTRDDVPTV